VLVRVWKGLRRWRGAQPVDRDQEIAVLLQVVSRGRRERSGEGIERVTAEARARSAAQTTRDGRAPKESNRANRKWRGRDQTSGRQGAVRTGLLEVNDLA